MRAIGQYEKCSFKLSTNSIPISDEGEGLV